VQNAPPVGTKDAIPVEILLMYYEQYTRNVKFGHLNRPGWQKTWRGSELWTPEKEKIDIGSTLQHPVFLPKGSQIQPAILPYVDMRTRSDDIEPAPSKPSSQKPNLFVLQDESSSMGQHKRGSRTWYRIIGSLTAIQSAVNANLKCCVMGFSADMEFHVNGEQYPNAYWLKDMAKLKAACVHHFDGNDTLLPPVARIVEASSLPVLTLFATDGEIKNLGSSLSDLAALTRCSNHLCVFLLGNEAENNKKLFMDINAEVYTPTCLDEFLVQMNACTNKVYG